MRNYADNYIPDLTERYPSGFNYSDRDEEEYERSQEYYRNNKKKLDEAHANGTLVYFSYDCVYCKSYEAIGCTCCSGWDIDDVEHGICHDLSRKDCEYRKNHPEE